MSNTQWTTQEAPGPSAAPGGFLEPHPGLLSPTPSTTASSSAGAGDLPRPRAYPLKSGSAKETMFINHVDRGIMQVQRKYAKKFSGEEEEERHGEGGLAQTQSPQNGVQERNIRGYDSFREAARDIDRLVDVVWVSGTPSLQVPYLLSLALLVVTYVPSFPPAPKTMFRLLRKLDHAFASLVQGHDIESGERLPGFEHRRGLNETEKVRIKSLVEKTRVTVVTAMNAPEFEEEEEEEDDEDDSGGVIDVDDLGTDFDMEVARVYDKTLVELGDTIGGPSIGIPDE